MNREKKILVAYFSCSGVTESAAKTLADAISADLYEIVPKTRYTSADLDWNNSKSRSSVEMKNPSARPEIGGESLNIGDYDVIFVGFPIWWYVAPKIINTFLESYGFSRKTIVPFATSGGSGLGKTEENLYGSCSASVNWRPGKLLSGRISKSDALKWVNTLDLG